MRSVYLRILLTSLATLILSLIAFVMVSQFVALRSAGGDSNARLGSLFLQQAVDAYQSGGPEKLARQLGQFRSFLLMQNYLTDARGRDLATGADRSKLLAVAGARIGRPKFHEGHLVVVFASRDGRYRLIVVFEPPVTLGQLAPYYLLILAAVALLCWALALSVASPLRGLARAVERFGRGDLTVRVNSRRKDEIGELSRAFDQMAERIGTLLEAERRLLQDVSHELRTPLVRMSFAIELVRRAVGRHAEVDRLQKEINRLTELVGTLLQVTRAEGDPSSGSPEQFELKALVEEVVRDCAVEADARGCRIQFESEGELTLSGERELLRRAVENIVRNGLRYTPPSSSVDVRLALFAGEARILVRDYGAGVPEDLVDKIFHPFFRVDDSRSASTGGVGLGLAIAQRAISVHHGVLRAENANPGLRVVIELPRPDAL